ncbi:MAG: DMT family transporter [Methylophilaceae bacterium]
MKPVDVQTMQRTALSAHASRRILIGVFCALIAAAGFSIKSILIKQAFAYGVDSVTLLALRMTFALPFFIGMTLWDVRSKRLDGASRPALSRRDWVIILGLSTAYYLFNYLDFLGLQTISAGLERMIQFLYPTMTVLLSAWLYKKALSRKVVMAMVLSYAGITLVFMHDISMQSAGIGLGAALVFASAMFYAIYLVGAGHVIPRMGATRFTAYAMIIASLASLLQFTLSHSLTALQQPLQVYELAIAMALFSTVLPVFMLAAGMRLIGSASTSLIGSIGPIFTIYLAHIFLHEEISLMQLLGSSLVLAGVILISRNSKQVPQTPV